MNSNIFSCEHLDENKICSIDGNVCSNTCDCYNSCDNCIHNDGTTSSCSELNGCISFSEDAKVFNYDIVSILGTIRNSRK